MTLYEMTKQANQLYEMLSEDEIDKQTFEDTLESIGTNEKIDSYCIIINQFEADTASIETEIERLKARKKTCEKSIDRMKNALDSFMQAKGSTKEVTDKFTVSYHKSERVQILNETSIPADYIKVKKIESVDKAGIKQAIKSGKAVPGAVLEEFQNLQIK